MTCKAIDSTPTNDKLGVTGMKCVDKWGTGVDHALTIVGYDDRIEFDIMVTAYMVKKLPMSVGHGSWLIRGVMSGKWWLRLLSLRLWRVTF